MKLLTQVEIDVLNVIKTLLVKSQFYEEASALRQIETLLTSDERMKNEMISFSEFILANYSTYFFVQKGFKVIPCYAKISDPKDWDGDPETVYNSEQVYNHYLNYLEEQDKKAKKEEPNDGTYFWIPIPDNKPDDKKEL